jgi:hypothetical protein
MNTYAPRVLILWATGIVIIDILCLSANPMLMNECDAPESNNTNVGWESMLNIPTITDWLCRISLSSV